jgi:signal peptidase I
MSDKPEPKPSKRRKILREARSWAFTIGLALVFRTFVASAYHIPSESMVPTLEVGDVVVVNKLSYALDPPARGDVIVFDHPREHGTDLIKRVVAVAGDRVEGREGTAWVNGTASGTSADFAPLVVPPGNLFVLGDNRENSADSRYWGFVPLGHVRGRAFAVAASFGGPERIRLRRWLRPIH